MDLRTRAEISGVAAERLRSVADALRATSPALVKCGWGLERNRNGGSAAAAVLALPAVGGKFGVRGGGYSMSNSASWGIERTWLRDQEPATRAVNMNRVGRELTDAERHADQERCSSTTATPRRPCPISRASFAGLEREDLFTVVFDQVLTDTALYADVVLPATTFLEHYDYAKGYGALSLQLGKPVIEAVGESRSNTDVFMDLVRRMELSRDGDPDDDLEAMLTSLGGLPGAIADELREHWRATPPYGGRPVQFVDVFPKTADAQGPPLPARRSTREAPLGLYGYQADPATERYPLALISPASERTVSSTLGRAARAPT